MNLTADWKTRRIFTNSSLEALSLRSKKVPFTSGQVKSFFLGRVNVRVSTYFESIKKNKRKRTFNFITWQFIKSISTTVNFSIASPNFESIIDFNKSFSVYWFNFVAIYTFVVCSCMIAFPLINNISDVCVGRQSKSQKNTRNFILPSQSTLNNECIEVINMTMALHFRHANKITINSSTQNMEHNWFTWVFSFAHSHCLACMPFVIEQMSNAHWIRMKSIECWQFLFNCPIFGNNNADQSQFETCTRFCCTCEQH